MKKKTRRNETTSRAIMSTEIFGLTIFRAAVEILPMIFNEWQSYSERERNGLHGRHCQVA
jgi:hypothetical protein